MIQGFYDCFKHWATQGTVWIYSDPHFNENEHYSISADEQVRRINSKVGKKDTLIILGDIGDIEYAKKLKGYKILIAGNHDSGLSNYKGVFDEVYGGALFIGEKLLLSHEPIDLPFAFNIHGHDHAKNHKGDSLHLNVCANNIDFTPINLNKFMKAGPLAHISSIHRQTIDVAVKRKKNKQKSIH